MSKSTNYTFDKAPDQSWEPNFTPVPGINAPPVDSKLLK